MLNFPPSASIARGFPAIIPPGLPPLTLPDEDILKNIQEITEKLGFPELPASGDLFLNTLAELNKALMNKTKNADDAKADKTSSTQKSNGAKTDPTQTQTNPVKHANHVIRDLYKKILGRSIEKEQFVLDNHSVYYMQNGIGETVKAFLNSPEYKNQKHSTDETVETLYKTILKRPSDPDGKQAWVKAINDGMSIDQVVDAFANSAEYQKGKADGRLD